MNTDNNLVATSGIASSVFRAGRDDRRWGTDLAGKRYALEAHGVEVTVNGYTFEVAICTGDTEQVVESLICSIARARDEAACAVGPATEAARSEHSNPLAQAPLDHAHVVSQGGYDGLIILPVIARTGLHWEIGASPVGLRSLDDAIGRALEIGYAEETIDQAGLFRLTLDELLISPTVVFAEGVNIAADTKHLRALRVTVKEAAAGGCCTCSSWGKEQSITVRRLEPAGVESKVQ